MLQCNPQGICSYNYHISGNQFYASTTFHSGHSGSILFGENSMMIGREGFTKETWHLSSSNNQLIATAIKPGPFSKRVDIFTETESYQLLMLSLSRATTLVGPQICVTFEPIHAFTRRAKITGKWDNPIIMLFGFWVTINTWARAAARSSATSGAVG